MGGRTDCVIEWIMFLATAVNVGLVGVLVWVTNEYRKATSEIAEATAENVRATRDMAGQAERDRLVCRIEKGLEEFYLPLVELGMWEGWKKYPYPPDCQLRSKWDVSKVLKVPAGGLADLKRFWLGVNSHRYLAVVGGTKELLIRFLQESENYWIHDESEKGGMEKSHEALLVAVKNDVEVLESRLRELYRYSF